MKPMVLLQRWSAYARQASPGVLLRVVVAAALLWPVLLLALGLSWFKRRRWSRLSTCRAFLRRQAEAFADLDPESLCLLPTEGGVSNATAIWRCRTTAGEWREYFVKVFLPLGSLWAMALPWVSPFPTIGTIGSRGRLRTEAELSRHLHERGVPVPHVVIADADAGVIVCERLHGQAVNTLLSAASAQRRLTPEASQMLLRCGQALGQAHAAGCSLVDAQPANCLWVPEERKIYLIDLEYATRRNQCAWDLAFFQGCLAAQLRGRVGWRAWMRVRDGYRRTRRWEGEMVFHRLRRRLEVFAPVVRAVLDLRETWRPAKGVVRYNAANPCSPLKTTTGFPVPIARRKSP